MSEEDQGLGGLQQPVLLAFLAWVTRQHDDALVTLCGLKLVGSSMKIGNLIEVFQTSTEEWASAHEFVDALVPGSVDEDEMICTGFLQLIGLERDTVAVIRAELSI